MEGEEAVWGCSRRDMKVVGSREMRREHNVGERQKAHRHKDSRHCSTSDEANNFNKSSTLFYNA